MSHTRMRVLSEVPLTRLCIVEVNVGQAKGFRFCRAGWARVANNGAPASFSRYGRDSAEGERFLRRRRNPSRGATSQLMDLSENGG
jgi:hypothetical protein